MKNIYLKKNMSNNGDDSTIKRTNDDYYLNYIMKYLEKNCKDRGIDILFVSSDKMDAPSQNKLMFDITQQCEDKKIMIVNSVASLVKQHSLETENTTIGINIETSICSDRVYNYLCVICYLD